MKRLDQSRIFSQAMINQKHSFVVQVGTIKSTLNKILLWQHYTHDWPLSTSFFKSPHASLCRVIMRPTTAEQRLSWFEMVSGNRTLVSAVDGENWNYRAEGLRSWLWFAGATSPWAGENVGAVLLPLKLYLPLILAFQFPHTAQTPPPTTILFPSLSLCFPYKDWPGHFLSFSVGGGRLVCEHGQVRRIAA